MISVLHLLAPAPVGGLESVVAGLAAGQGRRGHRVCVGAVVDPMEGHHEFLGSLEAAGVPGVRLEVPQRAYLREVREVRELLRRHRPDLVHTHGYRSDVIAGRTARVAGFPVVSTVHGFTHGNWKNRLYERLQRRSLRKFDAVVAVSRALGEELREDGIHASRLYVVPNAWTGGEELLERSVARRRLGLASDAFVIGWVGRLSHEKGPDILLRALALLPGEVVCASIVGDGQERAGLRRLANDLRVRDRVHFHGLVPGAAAFYRAFDVFALSSRTEGTPVSLLESMYAEIPVVATSVGGVPDVVGDDEAILIPTEDPEALADALGEIQQHPRQGRERARRARQRLVADFDWDKWLDRYDDVYKEITEYGKGSVR